MPSHWPAKAKRLVDGALPNDEAKLRALIAG
jgi:hypothetical protein